MQAPPPPKAYHWRLLSLANQIFEASKTYIINPRDIFNTSLIDADSDWIEDFHRYRQHLQFERDKDKRPPELR